MNHYTKDELKNIKMNFQLNSEAMLTPEFRKAWTPLIFLLIDQAEQALELKAIAKARGDCEG